MEKFEQDWLSEPYAGYTYAYPHKTAYRRLGRPVALKEAWAAERREALFLYLHLPFCEMRCGFCNLFTTVNSGADLIKRYLKALEGHARRVREALGDASFARLAIGGGTPTLLQAGELDRLFDLTAEVFGIDPRRIPISVETSPLTAEPDKLRLLRDRGVDRISIGVQSFIESEVHAVGRSQKTSMVERALGAIRETGFSTLNIDLIYGLPGQTVESWKTSLRTALQFKPEEIYLYPLYVRPLTGLGRRAGRTDDDRRLDCYRAGRALLIEAGYDQISMRMFRSPGRQSSRAPVYCCQTDGMVGLGCGARSYTRELHYSSEYAVGANDIRQILTDYLSRPAATFDFADYGFVLDGAEQRRRFIIQSLLQAEGLDYSAYRVRFGTEAEADLPELTELARMDLAVRTGGRLQLSETGFEISDAIGPRLYSTRVRSLMDQYELR
jgi:oxygen-independent coproporphyrinogen-3 oxidase